MKVKLTLVVILLTILILFAGSFFVFENEIKIDSNVPVKPQSILRSFGPIYLGVFPKKDAKLVRNFFSLEVSYFENPNLVVKFRNGIFGLTEEGFLISVENKNYDILATFDSSLYNIEMSSFLKEAKILGILSNFKSVDFLNYSIAFYDKNNIMVIIGQGNYKMKLLEYLKCVELYKNDLKRISTIDLRFNGQAVIKWRENG